MNHNYQKTSADPLITTFKAKKNPHGQRLLAAESGYGEIEGGESGGEEGAGNPYQLHQKSDLQKRNNLSCMDLQQYSQSAVDFKGIYDDLQGQHNNQRNDENGLDLHQNGPYLNSVLVDNFYSNITRGTVSSDL